MRTKQSRQASAPLKPSAMLLARIRNDVRLGLSITDTTGVTSADVREALLEADQQLHLAREVLERLQRINASQRMDAER